jgi:hypothetical protein
MKKYNIILIKIMYKEEIYRDSFFIQSLDKEENDFFEEIKKDLINIDYIYTDPTTLNLIDSLKLMNTLVKYDFKQIKDFTYLFYYKFGKFYFNNDTFMYGPNIFIENIHEEYIFEYLCKNGFLIPIKWIYSLGNIDIHEYKEQYFRIGCQNGHLELCQWIYSLGNIDLHIFNDKCFILACKSGNINLVKWLHSLDEFNIHINNEEPFRVSYIRSYIDICKYIYSCGNTDIHSDNDNIIKYEHNDLDLLKWLFTIGEFKESHIAKGFINSIISDNLEVLKFLYSKTNISKYYNDDQFIIATFMYNSLETAKWLYNSENHELFEFDLICENCDLEFMEWYLSLDNINIDPYKNGLRLVCIRGDLNLSKLLYSLDEVNKNNIERIFIETCEAGHLEVTQWLYNLLGDKKFNINGLFITACRKRNLKMCQWLYSLGGVDIHLHYDEPFKLACEYNCIKLVKWLYSLGNINLYCLNDCGIKLAIKNINIELTKWILSIHNPKCKYRYELKYEYNKKFLIFIKYLFSIELIKPDYDLFIIAVKNQDIELCKYLYSIGVIDIHKDNDKLFRMACKYDFFDIALWLYSLGNVDINIFDNYPMRISFKNNKFREWFTLLGVNIDGIDIEEMNYRDKFDNKRHIYNNCKENHIWITEIYY